AAGAFSAAFVPLVSGRIEEEGAEAGRRMAEQALALMISFLLPFVVLGLVFMPAVVTVLAPGFVDEPDKFDAAVGLARITFPYLLLISIVALLGGLLNSIGRFAPFAGAPILFNAALIVALLYAWFGEGKPAEAMAYAVTVAGVLQLILLVAASARAGVAPKLIAPQLGPDMRKLLKLMGPGLIGGGVLQINLMIDTILASLLPSGAISWLFYADRLYQLPLGVIGIAIGTALLPGLSRAVRGERTDEATHLLSRALEYGLLLALPAALGLALISGPIIGGLFQYGRFSPADTLATAAALSAYAIGIPAYVGVKVMNAAYFARQDTASPVKIAVISTMINTAFSIALIQVLGHAGIALATGITAWLNLALLARGLKRAGHFRLDDRIRKRLPRIVIAGAVMAASLLIALFVASELGIDTASDAYRRVGWMFGLIGLGAVSYAVGCLATGGSSLHDLKSGFARPTVSAD
ncbi:MAG: murein biosynthesis integral membrane protein MurJ, partial [Pseudomonadota bacterium]